MNLNSAYLSELALMAWRAEAGSANSSAVRLVAAKKCVCVCSMQKYFSRNSNNNLTSSFVGTYFRLMIHEQFLKITEDYSEVLKFR